MSGMFLYGYVPYVALLACIVGGVRRMQSSRTRAPQARPRAWEPGVLALVVGAGIVAVNHVLGLVLRGLMRDFLASPTRLFLFEAVSLIGGMLLAWGVLQVSLRRVRQGQASWGLRALYTLLLLQGVGGLAMAVGMRWGALWSLDITVPYLRSLLVLHPEVSLLEQAPLMVRLHVLLGFVVIAIAPFVQARRAAERVAVLATAEEPLLASRRQEIAPRAEP